MTSASRWIGVAVDNWQSPLLDSWYPEDVPEDWRLTYYANWSAAVVLQPAQWLHATQADVDEWLLQTHENFWFYPLLDSADSLEQLQAFIAMMAGRCGGVLLQTNVVLPEVALAVDVLRVGEQALVISTNDIKQISKLITSWLVECDSEHGLIVLTGEAVLQLQSVHTLLPLLGVQR